MIIRLSHPKGRVTKVSLFLLNYLPDLKISDLPEKWGIKNKGDFKLSYLIRRLRNAISHGNIYVSENLLFTFKDVNPQNESDEFTFSFEEYELRSFVHAFADWILKQRL